jgi:hypothetical protein
MHDAKYAFLLVGKNLAGKSISTEYLGAGF